MKNPSLQGVSRERIREEFIKGIQKGKSQKLFMEANLISLDSLNKCFPS